MKKVNYDDVSKLLKETRKVMNNIAGRKLFEDDVDVQDDKQKDVNIKDFKKKMNEIISRLAMLRDFIDDYAVFIDDMRLKFFKKMMNEFRGKDLKNMDVDEYMTLRKYLWDMIDVINKIEDKVNLSYTVKMEVLVTRILVMD